MLCITWRLQAKCFIIIAIKFLCSFTAPPSSSVPLRESCQFNERKESLLLNYELTEFINELSTWKCFSLQWQWNCCCFKDCSLLRSSLISRSWRISLFNNLIPVKVFSIDWDLRSSLTRRGKHISKKRLQRFTFCCSFCIQNSSTRLGKFNLERKFEWKRNFHKSSSLPVPVNALCPNHLTRFAYQLRGNLCEVLLVPLQKIHKKHTNPNFLVLPPEKKRKIFLNDAPDCRRNGSEVMTTPKVHMIVFSFLPIALPLSPPTLHHRQCFSWKNRTKSIWCATT